MTALFAAALEPFPTVRQPRVHRPVVGSPLTLRCRPPRSYPQPTIFWGVENVGLQQIDTDDRVTLDYLGTDDCATIRMSLLITKRTVRIPDAGGWRRWRGDVT